MLATELLGYGGATVGYVPCRPAPRSASTCHGARPRRCSVPGTVIALVGFAEPASVARTLAAQDRRSWDPDREFVSQGAANVAAGVTGGFPVGGSFSRSALTREAGGRTRWSGAVTGLAVLALLPFRRDLLVDPDRRPRRRRDRGGRPDDPAAGRSSTCGPGLPATVRRRGRDVRAHARARAARRDRGAPGRCARRRGPPLARAAAGHRRLGRPRRHARPVSPRRNLVRHRPRASRTASSASARRPPTRPSGSWIHLDGVGRLDHSGALALRNVLVVRTRAPAWRCRSTASRRTRGGSPPPAPG